MGHFYHVFRGQMLKVNLSKSKTLIFERDEVSLCNMSVNSEELEAVDELGYLRINFSKEGNGKANFEKKSCTGEILETR